MVSSGIGKTKGDFGKAEKALREKKCIFDKKTVDEMKFL